MAHRRPLAILIPVGLLAATTPGVLAAGPGASIVHEPVGCLVEARYPEVAATIESAGGVTEARLYFAPVPPRDAGEYWVDMEREGTRFVGRLPKPGSALEGVRYWIEARGSDGPLARTESHRAVVSPDEARCPGGARIAPEADSTEPVIVHPAGSD